MRIWGDIVGVLFLPLFALLLFKFPRQSAEITTGKHANPELSPQSISATEKNNTNRKIC